MKRQVLTAIVLTSVLIGGMALVKYQQISSAMEAAAEQQMPPLAVTSSVATAEEWPKTLSAVGTLTAVEGAMLSAESGGRVVRVAFKSGSPVEKGQVLVELDTSVEKAELEGAQARLANAEFVFGRRTKARKNNAISQADLDEAEAELRQMRAQVDRLKAVIERKKIIAPFSGKSGIRRINVGQTLSVGTPVVAVHAFDPLYVDFTLPQQSLGELLIGTEVSVSVDAYPNRRFSAKLTAIESGVNAETRNVSIQATLPNPEELLRAGMFVRAEVILPKKEKVISVPASSIKYAPYGDSIIVIEPSESKDPAVPRKVKVQTVKLGRRLGDRISVLSGLSAGDEVISSGTFKVRPDSMVIVNNSVTPDNKLDPSPEDT